MDNGQEMTTSPSEQTSRRRFLRMGMYGSVGLLFGTALSSSVAMLWPLKQAGFGAPIRAHKGAGEIRVGEVLTVREGKFYLAHTEDGFLALYWRCVHLGCTVPWVEGKQRFVCPCHGATYTITGVNVAGPAPRPLDFMPLQISPDGTITVDTGVIRQRSAYVPTQATKWA